MSRDLPRNAEAGSGVQDRSDTAVLIIDVINAFDFEDGPRLFRQAEPIAAPIAALKKRAARARVPCIYVNDNFGQWRSSFDRMIEACLDPSCISESFVRQVAPDSDDYRVLKPKHSAFFQTPLDLLLRYLGAKRLILTGIWTNNCVLFTAHDAYMRDFELEVPDDCVAAYSGEDQAYALNQMRTVLKAEISNAGSVRL